MVPEVAEAVAGGAQQGWIDPADHPSQVQEKKSLATQVEDRPEALASLLPLLFQVPVLQSQRGQEDQPLCAFYRLTGFRLAKQHYAQGLLLALQGLHSQQQLAAGQLRQPGLQAWGQLARPHSHRLALGQSALPGKHQRISPRELPRQQGRHPGFGYSPELAPGLLIDADRLGTEKLACRICHPLQVGGETLAGEITFRAPPQRLPPGIELAFLPEALGAEEQP